MRRPRHTALLGLVALAAAAAAQLAAAQADGAKRSSEPGLDLLMKGASLCMRGPNPTCCGLLNVALGNSQSPLAKCMCLANSLAAFEGQGFGLAHTVESCAAAGHGVDAAQALFKRQAEVCPAGAGEGGGSEREASLARVKPLMAVALDPAAPEWGVSNMRQGLLGGAAADGVSSIIRLLAFNALVWVPVAGAAVFAVALGVHFAAGATKRWRARFEGLGLEQRLVSYQHLMFAIVFGIQLVPYTYMTARFLFGKWSGEYMVGTDSHICDVGVIVGLVITSHAFLYCMEGGLRTLVKPNVILIIHHSLFFTLLAAGFWLGPSIMLIKFTTVLDLGAVHEAPLYIALLVYRLSDSMRAQRVTLIVALAWYAFTRLVQTALLIWMLAIADADLRTSAPYILSATIAAALSLVQAYTFRIYAGIYRRTGKPACGSPHASDEFFGPDLVATLSMPTTPTKAPAPAAHTDTTQAPDARGGC